VFTDEVYISALHEKYLPENYFPLVGSISRFPRYKNKRGVDPQVKMFVDEMKIEVPTDWGLPIPNPEAAYISLAKYGKDIPWMSVDQVEDMNLAWEWTETHFGFYMRDSRVRSLEEVVAKLDMSTSSGAPFNLFCPKKKELFEEHPEFIDWLAYDFEVNMLKDNYTALCTNSLKEELRTAAKISANSIRTFTAEAVDITTNGNRLCADMNEKMNASFLRSSSGVGMSPFRGNWDRLYRKLNVFRNGYALDESQYDSSLRNYLMWGCARFRWNMLCVEDRTPENLIRLKNLYRNLVHSLIVSPNGVLIFKLTGNPSGSPNTINDNTLILYTLLAYAWIRNAKERRMVSYLDFEANTAKVLVGDDNTWTVSDEAHSFYNARTVIAEWKLIGVTTTTDSLEPRLAEELDFLSAHTIFMNGMAVPIYDRKKLLAGLLYAPMAHITPAVTLTRVGSILLNGWTDIPMRNFCKAIIAWLFENYDKVLAEDQDWILAKCGLHSDLALERLYCGDLICYRQSVFGKLEEAMPNKNKMSNSNRVNTQPKGRRRGQRGAKARATRKPQQQQPPRMRQGPPRRRPNRRGQGRGPVQMPRQRGGRSFMLAGKGSTRNKMLSRAPTVIEEDEYIGAVTVAGQPNFNVVSYSVNIGNATTFPWGSTIAKNFEKYRFSYCEFYYKREVSEFATNGQVGKVMLSFDNDAADGAPVNKQQVEDTVPHSDGMPSENFALEIPIRELRRLVDGFFVRPAGLPGGTDIKTYDIGNLFVSTQGILNNVEVGELHVRYRCELFIPILEGTTQIPANNQVSVFRSNAVNMAATGNAYTILFATADTNGLGAVNTAGVIVPPAGNYLIDVVLNCYNTTNATALQVLAQLNKNGAAYNGLTNVIEAGATVAATDGGANVNFSTFGTANGTDSYSVQITGTYAAGQGATLGTIRFTAI